MEEDDDYVLAYTSSDDEEASGPSGSGSGAGATASDDEAVAAAAVSRALAAASGQKAAVPTPARIIRRPDYTLVHEEALSVRMAKEVAQLVEITSTDDEDAFTLLKAFKWQRRALEERIFDDDGLRSRLGVTAGPDPPPRPADAGATLSCAATLEEVPWEDADALPCGHFFSKAAWQMHTTAALAEGPSVALRLTCMEDGCHERVRPRMFRTYLASADQRARYEQARVRSFAEEDASIAWCPAPGCPWTVQYTGGGAIDVECPYGHQFCFKCRAATGWHRPASCEEVSQWLTREKDEGENATWLAANTKPCPKCKRSIEKNQGCNHMQCRVEAGGCGQHFCWICLKDWSGHRDYYSCSTPPPTDLYNASVAAKARAELQRYTFYYTRHKEQLKSEAFAKGTRPAIDDYQRRLVEEKRVPLAMVDFMMRALDVIVRGRHVAAWAYVHAFLIPPENTAYQALFEDSQAHLERNLEGLHEKLEIRTLERMMRDDVDEDDDDANAITATPVVTSASGSSLAAAGASSSSHSLSLSSSSSVGAFVATALGRFGEWRSKTTNLLAATDKYIDRLLDAVETGFLLGASAADTSDSGGSSSSSSGGAAMGGDGTGTVSGGRRTASRAGFTSPQLAKRRAGEAMHESTTPAAGAAGAGGSGSGGAGGRQPGAVITDADYADSDDDDVAALIYDDDDDDGAGGEEDDDDVDDEEDDAGGGGGGGGGGRGTAAARAPAGGGSS